MPRAFPFPRGFLVLCAVLTLACGSDDGGGPPDPPEAESIVVTPTHPAVGQGLTVQLTTSVVDGSGNPVDDQAVTFSSSDLAVATVSSTGLVTSVGPAQPVSITVAQGDLSASVDLTVQQRPTSITVYPDSLVLLPGKRGGLQPTVLDFVGDEIVAPAGLAYVSNTPGVATVNGSGAVTSVGPLGASTVTVSLGALQATTAVVVQAPGDTVVRTTLLAGAPYSVGVSLTGQMLLSLPATPNVVLGNLRSFTFPTPINLGLVQPLGVALNPAETQAYVGMPNGIALVDMKTGVATHPITQSQVGQVFSVLASPDGTRLFAGSTRGKTYAINTTTNAIIDSATTGVVDQMVMHPTLPRFYATQPGFTDEIDIATMDILRTFPMGGKGIAIAPDGSEIYLVDEATPLNVVTLSNGTVTPVTTLTGFGLAVRDGVLFLSNASHVQLIDRATRTVTKTIDIGTNNRRPTVTSTGTVIVPDEDGRVHFIR